jgi:hypothetical protein
MKGTARLLRPALGSLTLALGIVAASPADAWAYIDPGTGSYLFQLTAAGLLAGVYTVRRYWFALTSALRGRPSAAGADSIKRANDVE